MEIQAMVTLTLSLASLPMIVVGAAIFILGVFVVAREHARSFLILTAAVALWLVPIGLMIASVDGEIAFAFARIAYVGVALIPAAVLQFTMSLLGKSHPRIMAAVWIVGAIFAGLFVFTNVLLAGTYQYSWGFYPRLTEATALYLAYFTALLAASLSMLRATPTGTELERRRNDSFFFALAVGYLGSVDWLPAFGIDIYPFGCAAILGFVGLSAITALRFRLRDLTPSFVADRLLQTMQGGVLVVDTTGRVRVANEAAARLLGSSVGEMNELDLPSFLGMSRLPVTDSESFAKRSVSRDRFVRWQRRDGSPVELSVSASALKDDFENIVGVLYALSDVSATHDMLTSVPNRVHFAAMFEKRKSAILASGRVPAVLFIDLDGFKAVNDEHGHAAGDALLQLVTRRVRHAIRGDDVVARYGGDEFVVLVDLAKAEDANFVATKLRRVISDPYMIEEKTITIGASIGVSFYPVDGPTVDDLMKVADSSMYRAKKAGKVRTDVAVAPPFNMNATA